MNNNPVLLFKLPFQQSSELYIELATMGNHLSGLRAAWQHGAGIANAGGDALNEGGAFPATAQFNRSEDFE